jgi:Flp pilus assembly pilin Flp
MFVHHRRGSTHTEYVLIAAVISIAVLTGSIAVGGSLDGIFNAIADVLNGF